MSYENIRKRIIEKLDEIKDIHSENWNDLQWKIINSTRKEFNYEHDEFAVSNIYNIEFNNKLK